MENLGIKPKTTTRDYYQSCALEFWSCPSCRMGLRLERIVVGGTSPKRVRLELTVPFFDVFALLRVTAWIRRNHPF